jgi:hypothetical protein
MVAFGGVLSAAGVSVIGGSAAKPALAPDPRKICKMSINRVAALDAPEPLQVISLKRGVTP